LPVSSSVMKPLDLPPEARVVFLTGAGVSVASGLRPYRGHGGLFSEFDVERYVTKSALARDPEGCWRAHRAFARIAAKATPNPAHESLAAFARARPPGSVVVITQNVDALHLRAGSTEVIELHGSLDRVRCTDPRCGARAPAPDPARAGDAPPPCPRCLEPVRYDIVLFDEHLSPTDERAAKIALRTADLFVAVGTSGVVFPAAAYVREAEYAGARTMLVNLEPPDPPNPYFQDVFIARAEEALPALLGAR
jgi:NAD-dependent SIR2 family protein deacetylase